MRLASIRCDNCDVCSSSAAVPEAAFGAAGIATELMPRADFTSTATHMVSVRDRATSALERDA